MQEIQDLCAAYRDALARADFAGARAALDALLRLGARVELPAPVSFSGGFFDVLADRVRALRP